ncbi:MAG: TlpA family protein disulfide reductase [Actinomycetota bacterium]
MKASDWPDLSRHSGVDRLPTDPGRYVMIFQAEYPEGVAMIARTVDLVAPGTVQIAATEGGGVGNASATFVVDGAAVPGILRESSFHHSDAVGLLPGERPPGDPTFIDVSLRANIVLGEGPTDRRLRLSPEPPPWDDGVGTRVEPGPLVEIDPGRYLLTYDVAWKHGRVGWDSEGTLETARFAFPIEIVDEGASVVDAVEAAAAPILGSLPPRSFDGPTLHGKALDPADFDDRAIIAVAWSPSCVSCNRVLGRIQNALVSSRLFPSVIGVVPRSDRARAIEVEEVLSLTFESVLARASLLEGVTFPSTWIMRPDGTVVAIQVGHVDEAWLAGAIADATFGEPEPTLEGPAGTDPASSSESTSIPDVLRVRCTADGAQVLTPNVETSDDGVRVIATPGSAQHADAIEIRPLGWPIFNVSSGSSGIDGEFVRPVPEGDVIVGCYREKVEYAS